MTLPTRADFIVRRGPAIFDAHPMIFAILLEGLHVFMSRTVATFTAHMGFEAHNLFAHDPSAGCMALDAFVESPAGNDLSKVLHFLSGRGQTPLAGRDPQRLLRAEKRRPVFNANRLTFIVRNQREERHPVRARTDRIRQWEVIVSED